MATNGNKTVLLVTGDPAQAEALRSPLSEHGYRVVTAENGAAGLLAAHAERPALAVVDAEMPVMDGYRMLEVLRDDPATRSLAVILLTPGATETELARGWLCGADFCLPRDSVMADLLLMVERTLRLEETKEVSLTH
jgi:DNA-binding response OmpR family regulator